MLINSLCYNLKMSVQEDNQFDGEGHLSWMETTLSSFLPDVQQKQDYVSYLLSKPYEYTEEWEMPKEENLYFEQNPKYASLFAIQLNKAAMKAYVEDFEDAIIIVEDLRKFLPKLVGEHARLLKPVEYAMESLQWSVSKSLLTIVSLEISEKHFEEKWKAIEGDQKSMAVMFFLRGSLQRELLGYNEDQKLQLFKQVAEMDPDYHVWYHFAYQRRRGMRLQEDRSVRPPSEEEGELCHKAYQLAPNIVMSIFDMALLLKDTLWIDFFTVVRRRARSFEISDRFAECLELFNRALGISEENKMSEKLGVKIKLQKGELLQYFGRSNDEQVESLSVFLNCLELDPGNASVHQKLGRFFLYGIPGSGDLRNLEKARDHFKMGIEFENYKFIGCLREYIRLFGLSHASSDFVKEALDILTKSLEACTSSLSSNKRKQVVEILIWKGCIQWIYSSMGDMERKQAACEDWLSILEKHEDQKEMLFASIWAPPFTVAGHDGHLLPAHICTNELRNVLQMKETQSKEVNQEKRNKAVGMLLEYIRERPRPCHLASCVGVQSEQDHGNETWRQSDYRRSRQMSEADRDDNWRS